MPIKRYPRLSIISGTRHIGSYAYLAHDTFISVFVDLPRRDMFAVNEMYRTSIQSCTAVQFGFDDFCNFRVG